MSFAPLLIFFSCFFNIGLINGQKNETQLMEFGNCECGRGSPSSMRNFVVNGRPVTPTNKYPWKVALMRLPSRKIFCGGAIISQYFILTAAHCVERFSKIYMTQDLRTNFPRMKTVFLRSGQFLVGFLTRTHKPTAGAVVEQIFVHPGYSSSTSLANDIALLKLKIPIRCNAFARPICLPDSNTKVQVGDTFSIIGWGSENGNYADATETLNEATIMLQNPEKCKDIKFYNENRDGAFCTSGYKRGSPCYGDSGGIMFKQYRGRYFAIGVASSMAFVIGKDCDITTGNFVYTSVQKYMPWIRQITGINSMAFLYSEKLLKRQNGKYWSDRRSAHLKKSHHRG